MWVKPRSKQTEVEDDSLAAMADKWIDFCWESKAAKQISLFTEGLSPVLWSMKPEKLPQDLRDNTLLTSAAIQSDRSDFLLPQTPQTQQQYRDLWLKIRRS